MAKDFRAIPKKVLPDDEIAGIASEEKLPTEAVEITVFSKEPADPFFDFRPVNIVEPSGELSPKVSSALEPADYSTLETPMTLGSKPTLRTTASVERDNTPIKERNSG